MKVCSVCNEIVAANQGCARSDCLNQSKAITDPAPKIDPGLTGKADRFVKAGLDGAGGVARETTKRIFFVLFLLSAVILVAYLLVTRHSDGTKVGSDWVLFGSGHGINFFIDRNSIEQIGSYKRAKLRMEMPNFHTSKKEEELVEFDCYSSRERVLQSTIFFRDGGTSTTSTPGDWRITETGAPGSEYFDYVCFGVPIPKVQEKTDQPTVN
ncbi:hypothetical protein [Porphyrobacter sp. AAP82]|uniref:hypothetical protein n=1 Tax=Porphyrobacter sp. AAP82 TaxID=1248917 RepID=UPI0012DC42B6|nr:hypothetical protein [Porphyrobacter sp. AAP82]